MKIGTLITFILLIPLLNMGCSSLSIKKDPITPTTPPPFELKVVKELNDGTNIHILAELTPFIKWKISNVSLKLTGLKDGDTISEKDYKLKELLQTSSSDIKEDYLAAKSPIRFALTTTAQDITDYQLELFWGEGDEKLLESRASAAFPLQPLTLEDLRVETFTMGCLSPPCGKNYKVIGKIVNQGTDIVGQVTLGASFAWVPNGSTFEINGYNPSNEKHLKIEQITLNPGDRKAFKIDLDRTVPDLPGGRYIPIIRILN